MKNVNCLNKEIRTSSARIVFIIILSVLLTQVLGDKQSPQGPKQKGKFLPEKQKQHIAGRLASGYGLGSFRPSLEMKENVDFFLTPALLVQEAISEDVIMTYPTE